MTLSKSVLQVRNLAVSFNNGGRALPALEDVSFDVDRGETLAIVGESGSGKTITSLALMNLLSAAKVTRSGSALLQSDNGHVDLLRQSEHQMCDIRGAEIAMIFQEPMTSLNPVHTVGAQIIEAIMLHDRCRESVARKRAAEMIDLVGMPDPKRQLAAYPHQLSGGMRQRVMIAIALSCSPRLLIADEPTTALDVTIQAQILHLMRDLQKKLGMAMIFVTHDLGVVRQIAQRVCVMYSGQVVEQGPVQEILRNPAHPYTRGLIRSIPSGPRKDRLFALPGRVPGLADRPAGCLFAPRCQNARPEVCTRTRPPVETVTDGHALRCLRWRELPEFRQENANAI